MLKSKVDYKKSNIPEFIDKVYDLIIDQQEELQRAICAMGKWRFCKEFKFLEVSSADWFCMDPDARKRYFESRVRGTYMTDAETASNSPEEPVTTASSSSQQSTSRCSLSVSVQSFYKSVSVPLQTLQGIWVKATALLSDSSNFSLSPGCA